MKLPAEFKALVKAGYKIDELTPYQFRVESFIDLYPKRQRFHNIATQERGQYAVKDLPQFIKAQLEAAQTKKPAAGKWHDPAEAPWWTKVGAK